MCSSECICEAGAAQTYVSVDWSFWPSVVGREPITTGTVGTVATYQDCIKNAPDPTSSADEFKTFAKSYRDQLDY